MTINCYYCNAEETPQAKNSDVRCALCDVNVSDAVIRFCVLDYKDAKFSFICWPCIKKRGEQPRL